MLCLHQGAPHGARINKGTRAASPTHHGNDESSQGVGRNIAHKITVWTFHVPPNSACSVCPRSDCDCIFFPPPRPQSLGYVSERPATKCDLQKRPLHDSRRQRLPELHGCTPAFDDVQAVLEVRSVLNATIPRLRSLHLMLLKTLRAPSPQEWSRTELLPALGRRVWILTGAEPNPYPNSW